MDDPVLLSRIQFAFTICFHFLFPPISIGLAWLLVIVEGLSWRGKSESWESAGRFFAKLLALTFAVGVATGIVMEFQFGTNWAGYSRFVGDVFGAPLAAEGLFAFFVESTFLGLYLFGRGRVNKSLHWFSIFMVAVGATISAFWIIAANSWQQTPAGHVLRNGRAELVDFWAMVFNPSTMIRFTHTITACMVVGAFFMIGVSAYLLLKNRQHVFALRTMKIAVIVGFIGALLVCFPTGHKHAVQVAHLQPAKFAALEGLYVTQTRAPLVTFGLVKTRPPELKAKIVVPISGLLSYMAFGDVDAQVKGIDAFPEDETPPLWITFVSFHNMVLLGSLFVLLLLMAGYGLWRGDITKSRKLLKLLFVCSPLPLFACQFGWIVAEVGRQPWVVYGILKTSDAVSTVLTAGEAWFSLIMFILIYSLLFVLYLFLLQHEMGEAVDCKLVEGGSL